jgi:hypothetical protein
LFEVWSLEEEAAALRFDEPILLEEKKQDFIN